jgi:hypothetical protein
MREHGIRARLKRRSKATTDSKHSMPVADSASQGGMKLAPWKTKFDGHLTYSLTSNLIAW